jgi:hypothetical protein
VSGNTRHVATRLAFMRELKEQGILEVKWISETDNEVDMFTKNLDGTTHERHSNVYLTKTKEK